MRTIIGTAILAVVLVTPARSQEVREPGSGVTFAARSDGHSLLGTGLRIKKIGPIKVKVYAVGLYVSDSALAGPLAAHRGHVGTPAFYGDLLAGDFPKYLLLKFVRGLGKERIQEAMREALTGRTDARLLEQFVSYFPEIKKGQECVMRWESGGALAVSMAGQSKPPIADRGFAEAVFGLYLGEKPLQSDIKQGLVSRAGELLKP